MGPDRRPYSDMPAEEVVAIVAQLVGAGVEVWLEGGWGVDALLGEQTREHDDLDLVVGLEEVPQLREILGERGYELRGGAPPTSFELVDSGGRQVDVHPVTWQANGEGLYLMHDGRTWPYPARGFRGTGRVLGRRVRCLTPEVQVIAHAGYELDETDLADVNALRERFDLRE